MMNKDSFTLSWFSCIQSKVVLNALSLEPPPLAIFTSSHLNLSDSNLENLSSSTFSHPCPLAKLQPFTTKYL